MLGAYSRPSRAIRRQNLSGRLLDCGPMAFEAIWRQRALSGHSPIRLEWPLRIFEFKTHPRRTSTDDPKKGVAGVGSRIRQLNDPTARRI